LLQNGFFDKTTGDSVKPLVKFQGYFTPLSAEIVQPRAFYEAVLWKKSLNQKFRLLEFTETMLH
jgi:hypothetical protein